MDNFELQFAKAKLKEAHHYANIYRDSKYRGWYKCVLKNHPYKDTIVRFRFPAAMKLYDEVLRRFSKEERMIGIHRMLIGKDLKEELKEILKGKEDISEVVQELSDEEVKNLLTRLGKVVTFDCNKIPYLHIREKQKEPNKNKNDIIKEFLDSQIDYLSLFYDVLNENISIEECEKKSNGIIYNEFVRKDHE